MRKNKKNKKNTLKIEAMHKEKRKNHINTIFFLIRF